MQSRVVTSIVGLPVLVTVVWLGLPWLTIFVGITSVVALYEFHRLVNNHIHTISRVVAICSILGLLISVHSSENLYVVTYIVMVISITTSLPLIIINLNVYQRHLKQTQPYQLSESQPSMEMARVVAHSIVMVGPILVAFLLTHSIMLLGSEIGDIQSRNWLLYALFTTFATDTSAFLIGSIYGRHRLAPSISPNKTLEGAFGGFTGSVLVSVSLTYLLQLPLSLFTAIWFGLLLGVMGQLGDLLESYIKRIFDVKDTGNILPGHGGLLDRIDSLVVNIPVVYYLVLFIV